MSEIEYPFTPNEHGIPFSTLFQRVSEGEITGTIQGGSGSELTYEIQPDLIYIQDKVYPDRLMAARFEEGVARFEIQTRESGLDVVGKNIPWEVHPDMYAREFVGVSLAHFARNGLTVNTCKGIWKPGSDNYQQYRQELQLNGNYIRAAKQTKSAKIFAAYGYTEVTKEDIGSIPLWNTSIVTVLFHKRI